jgi:hypothetical protein
MEYVVKDLKDRYITGYLENIIDDKNFDTKFKVKSILSLINDIADETKDIERILNSNEKFSATLNSNDVGVIHVW